MSLATLAIVNGALGVAVLAALVHVSAIPFRIDRPQPARRARLATEVAGEDPAYRRTVV